MHRWKRVSVLMTALASAAATVAVLVAQGPPTAGVGAFPRRPAGDAKSIANGKVLYGTNCAYCHGDDTRGGENGGTNLLRSDFVMKDKSGETIGQFLIEETAQSHKFTFTREQVEDVAAFIHSFPLNSRDPGRMRPKTILVGDAKAGESYFKAKCASCHSATGDLGGFAKGFDDTRSLQERWIMPLVYTTRGIPATYTGKVPSVTVTLQDGTKVEGRLGRIDDFIVTLTETDGRARSFRRDGNVPRVEVHDPMQGHKALLPEYTDRDIHNVTAYMVTLQ
jgi:cytochrome c oxidase cbb3-type subunit III